MPRSIQNGLGGEGRTKTDENAEGRGGEGQAKTNENEEEGLRDKWDEAEKDRHRQIKMKRKD